MALDYLTADTQEVKDALACIADAERALQAAERNYRPVICGERYMTGDEVCEYLHISPRTLQTLRDMRRIPFTSVGERLIIYPESGIQGVLQEIAELHKPSDNKGCLIILGILVLPPPANNRGLSDA